MSKVCKTCAHDKKAHKSKYVRSEDGRSYEGYVYFKCLATINPNKDYSYPCVCKEFE